MSIEQFRSCLANEYARKAIGIEISDEEAESLLGDDAKLREAYAQWTARRYMQTRTGTSTSPPGRDLKRARRQSRWALAIAILTATLAVASIALIDAVLADARSQITELRETLQQHTERLADLTEQGQTPRAQDFDVRAIYDASLTSIVTVRCGNGAGTGFAYNATPPDGYSSVILTNHHVIESCTFDEDRVVILVRSDQTEVEGYVWGWDAKNDLATISTSAKLPPLSDARDAQIGDPVIAIGSPLGLLPNSVTRGIISNVYPDAYQTDTAVNHGNSGGPLLDRDGRVLGVVTLGLDREGLNIAVRTTKFCDQILQCD
ncbi:S1C family serine protease [Microbacterium lacusdiani]